MQKNERVKALALLKQTYFLSLKIGNWFEAASSQVRIAALEDISNKYASSLSHRRIALQLFKKIGEKGHIARTLAEMGQSCLLYVDQLTNPKILPADSILVKTISKQAVDFLEQAVTIAKPISSWSLIQGCEKSLSEAYALAGNYKQELLAYQNYITYRDSLNNIETDRAFNKQLLESEYNSKKDSISNIDKLRNIRLQFLEQQNTINQFKLKQQWLYATVVIFSLCLIAIIFLFRNHVKSSRLQNELNLEKTHKILKEAEYKSRMNDITFSALRSQMNPHFIFNCLNSIKLYTEQNNTEAASLYLTKFSRLIRSMLDSARSEKITLASEIELIKLYLDMESMRLKEKLTYSVMEDKNMDIDFIEISPLLIQPYVENAIWHGIMHKEEGGTINIKLGLSSDEEFLIITVSDNGVGRKKSAELKDRNIFQHTSHGSKLTSERIAMINEKYNAGAEVITTDLTDTNHKPCGTLVTIKLPVK